MAVPKVQEIAGKLQNLLQISQQLQQTFCCSSSSQYIGLDVEDKKSLTIMPNAMKEFSEVIKHLQSEWQHIIETGLDLGNITSYAGSVFKPKEVPLVQVVHCVISDMEMLLSETSQKLSNSNGSSEYENFSVVIGNIYAVLLSSQFLCHNYKTCALSNKNTPFPSILSRESVEKVVNLFPDFNERVKVIGAV